MVKLLVALAVIASLVLIAGTVVPGARDEVVVAPMPVSVYDERLDQLHKEALEQAYRNQLTRLFEVWMKDPADQPERASNGVRQARRAFIAVMTELDRRK